LHHYQITQKESIELFDIGTKLKDWLLIAYRDGLRKKNKKEERCLRRREASPNGASLLVLLWLWGFLFFP
jgi:hypothetical protein